ncbi:MAG TPA: hypothetical protein VN444_04020, partial [Verrucomicrobiae bacterium]|nr:hypothetical protein [Verrucomicrobiae bacterium]
MKDTEPVTIHSLDPPRKIGDGELFLGGHGLPMVRQFNRAPGTQYDVWAFPNNWCLKGRPGPLLDAWLAIEQAMSDLAEWQRRHEGCGRTEPR